MYITGNPVPSDKIEDLSDNGKVFDTLVTQTEGTTTDRLGRTRRVFQQILMDMGFQPLSGSFQTGATITARNQTLYDEVSKVFYSWGGVIPDGGYIVPVGSTPATAGGVGVGAWVDKTDLMLRSELEQSILTQRYNARYALRDFVSVSDYITDLNSVSGHSTAIQLAINSGAKQVVFPDLGFPYKIEQAINFTNRTDVALIGLGANQSISLEGHTSGWIVDMSGSNRCVMKNLFLNKGNSGTSIGGLLLAPTSLYSSCQYNYFENVYVNLFSSDSSLERKAIGIAIVGAEENTFNGLKVSSNSPIVLSTQYSTISSDYPSPYQHADVIPAHSTGVNTFSGETFLVRYDAEYPVISGYGANSCSFENAYASNVQITTNGSHDSVIGVEGGTLEGWSGKFKVEEIQSLLGIYQETSELFSWNFAVQYGGGVNSTSSSVKLDLNNAVFAGKIHDFELHVSFASPVGATKPLFSEVNVLTDGVRRESFSNVNITTNQTFSSYAPITKSMCECSHNVNLYWKDVSYHLNKNNHKKVFSNPVYTGQGLASSVIATIHLPSISAGFSARTINTKLSGVVQCVNTGGGASEGVVSVCPFIESTSAVSKSDGAMIVSAASDSLIAPTANSAISTDSGLCLYSGVDITQAYDSGNRLIGLTATPTGSGANISAVSSFLVDLTLNMTTAGRPQELVFIE